MTDPESSIPSVPAGLGIAGARLWSHVMGDYELEEHETRLLLEMCRTADMLDLLAGVVADEGAIDPRTGRAHPALVESRQLRIAFARLSAALRLPAGDENDRQQGARRPQRRVGARGVYGIRGVAS
jgi:hypothetical protein